eukprot:Rmarinus@m.29124
MRYRTLSHRVQECARLRRQKKNDRSSRSHAIFTIKVLQQHPDPAGGVICDVCACLRLVDLAGSERVGAVTSGNASDPRFKEGANINKSLTTLGSVIKALSEQNRTHIPYRDSKLTRILRDALGGNSCTTMIATVSPSAPDASATLGTLQYASRASKIQNQARLGVDPRTAEILRLRAEVKRLRGLLAMAGIDGPSVPVGGDMPRHSSDRDSSDEVENSATQNSKTDVALEASGEGRLQAREHSGETSAYEISALSRSECVVDTSRLSGSDGDCGGGDGDSSVGNDGGGSSGNGDGDDDGSSGGGDGRGGPRIPLKQEPDTDSASHNVHVSHISNIHVDSRSTSAVVNQAVFSHADVAPDATVLQEWLREKTTQLEEMMDSGGNTSEDTQATWQRMQQESKKFEQQRVQTLSQAGFIKDELEEIKVEKDRLAQHLAKIQEERKELVSPKNNSDSRSDGSRTRAERVRRASYLEMRCLELEAMLQDGDRRAARLADLEETAAALREERAMNETYMKAMGEAEVRRMELERERERQREEARIRERSKEEAWAVSIRELMKKLTVANQIVISERRRRIVAEHQILRMQVDMSASHNMFLQTVIQERHSRDQERQFWNREARSEMEKIESHIEQTARALEQARVQLQNLARENVMWRGVAETAEKDKQEYIDRANTALRLLGEVEAGRMEDVTYRREGSASLSPHPPSDTEGDFYSPYSPSRSVRSETPGVQAITAQMESSSPLRKKLDFGSRESDDGLIQGQADLAGERCAHSQAGQHTHSPSRDDKEFPYGQHSVCEEGDTRNASQGLISSGADTASASASASASAAASCTPISDREGNEGDDIVHRSGTSTGKISSPVAETQSPPSPTIRERMGSLRASFRASNKFSQFLFGD